MGSIAKYRVYTSWREQSFVPRLTLLSYTELREGTRERENCIMPPNAKKTDSAFVWMALYGGGLVYALYLALSAAYTIRLRAILDYGPVIHEFDPYFNYRATEVCIATDVLL